MFLWNSPNFPLQARVIRNTNATYKEYFLFPSPSGPSGRPCCLRLLWFLPLLSSDGELLGAALCLFIVLGPGASSLSRRNAPSSQPSPISHSACRSYFSETAWPASTLGLHTHCSICWHPLLLGPPTQTACGLSASHLQLFFFSPSVLTQMSQWQGFP